jgi:hypothetical protein
VKPHRKYTKVKSKEIKQTSDLKTRKNHKRGRFRTPSWCLDGRQPPETVIERKRVAWTN